MGLISASKCVVMGALVVFSAVLANQVHAEETMEEFIKNYPAYDKVKHKDAAKAHATKQSIPLPVGTQLTIRLVSGREMNGKYGGLSGDFRRMKLGHRWIPLTDVPGRYLIRIDPSLRERERKKAYAKYMDEAESDYKKSRKAAINAHLKKLLASPENLGTADRKIIYGYKVTSLDAFGVVLETEGGQVELRYSQIARMHRLRFKTGVDIADLEGRKYLDIHVLRKSETELVVYDGSGKNHKIDPRFLSPASRKALDYLVTEEKEPEAEPL